MKSQFYLILFLIKKIPRCYQHRGIWNGSLPGSLSLKAPPLSIPPFMAEMSYPTNKELTPSLYHNVISSATLHQF
nr:MAG TPA: hypothetical protein [Caudoviricetes sp.]